MKQKPEATTDQPTTPRQQSPEVQAARAWAAAKAEVRRLSDQVDGLRAQLAAKELALVAAKAKLESATAAIIGAEPQK